MNDCDVEEEAQRQSRPEQCTRFNGRRSTEEVGASEALHGADRLLRYRYEQHGRYVELARGWLPVAHTVRLDTTDGFPVYATCAVKRPKRLVRKRQLGANLTDWFVSWLPFLSYFRRPTGVDEQVDVLESPSRGQDWIWDPLTWCIFPIPGVCSCSQQIELASRGRTE